MDFSWSQWPVWRAGVESSQQCKQTALVKEMNSIRIPLLLKPSWAWATLTSLVSSEIWPWPPGFYLCNLGPLLFAPYPPLSTILCGLRGNAVRPALRQPAGIKMRSFCFLTSFLMSLLPGFGGSFWNSVPGLAGTQYQDDPRVLALENNSAWPQREENVSVMGFKSCWLGCVPYVRAYRLALFLHLGFSYLSPPFRS